MTPTQIWRALRGLFTFAPQRLAAIASSAALIAAVLVVVPVQPAAANTTYTFTNAGRTGADGPTQAQVTSAYSGTPLASSVTVSTQGVQEWVVPYTGTYKFKVVGAHGAASLGAGSSVQGGRSVILEAERDLTAGQVLFIVVGQAGTGDSNHGGGGGASFVAVGSRSTSLTPTNTIIAGGGGGTRTDATANGGDANTQKWGLSSGSNFGSGSATATHDNTKPHGFKSSGDTPSNGTTEDDWTNLGMGGLGADNGFGDGGAGWAGDGLDDDTAATSKARKLNGAATGGKPSSGTAFGGFGGGGSGQGRNGGGGGGGYTGGNAGYIAGGGGSYAEGFLSTTFTLDTSRSYPRGGTPVHGYVSITQLSPAVVGFSSSQSSRTNSTSIAYTLTMSQSITGLGSDDFANTGSAEGCSFSPNAFSGTVFTITVTNCTEGTLRPTLKANSISSTAGSGPSVNSDATTTITIDRTAPTITLAPETASPTKNPTLVFRVTSNETLSPVPATGNFSVSGTGCSVNSVTTHVTNRQWNVNVTCSSDSSSANFSHNQNVALTLTQGALKDPAGNTAPPSAITTASIVTDYVAPALTVARPATPTNALTHPYVFTPTETLNRDLALADFVLTQTSGTGCAFDADGLVKDAPSAGSYSLMVACDVETAHESAFNITMAAGSTAGGAALVDAALNPIEPVISTQTAVTIDRFTTISSIAVDPNPATGFTNADDLDYTINFSEPVSHLTLNQISVSGAGCQPAITSPAVLDDAGARYTQATIRVSGCEHDAEVQFAIGASASGVKDAVGNTALNGVTTASPITIDRVAPEFVSSAPTTANGTSFHSSSTISYSFIFDEPVTGLTADMFTATACNGTTTVSGSGTSFTVTFAGCADGPITPIASLTGDIKDLADNPHAVQTVNLPAVTVDTVAPTVEWEALAQGAELTNASSISFAIVFSESIDASSFSGDDITNAGTATGCNFTVTEDTGAVTPSTRFIVTATSCYDLGASATVQPRITNGSVTDRAGNALSQTEQLRTAAAVTLDRTVPTASFTSGPPQRTNAALSYSLLFSEPITGLTNADFEFSGSADGCLISITPDATNPTTVFDIEVTGCTDGTFSLILKANSVADSATNLGPSFDVTAAQITIDTVPAVATVTATGGVTKSRDSFVTFDIDFDEPVYGLVADTNAFEVGGTGCQVGTLTPSGLTTFAQAVSNYSLTITGCADATDATLAVKPDSATDVAGNLGPEALSSAASIEIDRVAAEVVSFTAGESDELGQVEFTVTFNEPIADASVSAADFEPATGSVPLVTPFTVTRVSSTQYAVATQALTQGDARVRLKANSITDAIGNPSPLAAQDSEPAAVTLPALSGGFSLQPAPNAGGFVNSTTLRYELALSRAIDTADAQQTLTAADLDLGAISCDNTVITPLQPFLLAIELTGCGNGPITLGIKPDAITDPDGNTWPATQLDAVTFEYDTVAPTATITAPIDSQFLVRHEFVVQFSEPVSGFSAATDITLAAGSTATGCQFGFITETTSRYRVITSKCSNGTIGITLAQNAVTDRAGNQGPVAAVTSTSITQSAVPVSNTPPSVSRVAPPDPTDPNSPNFDPNFDPNAPAPSQPTVLARAPERFIGPLSAGAQAQLVAAGVVRVDQAENFAVNSITASFAALPEWNTPAQIAQQISVEAGELVLVEVTIHPDAAPYMQAQGYLKTDDGWVILGNHDFDSETSVLSVPAMFANPGNYFMRIVMVETGAPPEPPVTVSLGGFSTTSFSTTSFSPSSFGIASTLTDEQVMALGTQALEVELTVTGTALTLTPLPTSAPSYDGPLVDNAPVRVTTLGGAATFTGQKLSLVSGARVLGAAQPIQSATANALTITVLPLEPGLYDLELTGSFGRLTIQGALQVVAENYEGPGRFFTKRISETEVKVYLRDIIAIGKVQIFVNGRERAWIRPLDSTDPKLASRNGESYMVRTVTLQPGKNRIEIRVNNQRARFVTYVP